MAVIAYYGDKFFGQDVISFDSSDKHEFKILVSWFKANYGKSHGQDSMWWIRHKSTTEFQDRPSRNKMIVTMKRSEHSTLAIMVWG